MADHLLEFDVRLTREEFEAERVRLGERLCIDATSSGSFSEASVLKSIPWVAVLAMRKPPSPIGVETRAVSILRDPGRFHSP
jgi:hypothetical protein